MLAIISAFMVLGSFVEWRTVSPRCKHELFAAGIASEYIDLYLQRAPVDNHWRFMSSSRRVLQVDVSVCIEIESQLARLSDQRRARRFDGWCSAWLPVSHLLVWPHDACLTRVTGWHQPRDICSSCLVAASSHWLYKTGRQFIWCGLVMARVQWSRNWWSMWPSMQWRQTLLTCAALYSCWSLLSRLNRLSSSLCLTWRPSLVISVASDASHPEGVPSLTFTDPLHCWSIISPARSTDCFHLSTIYQFFYNQQQI